MLLLLFLFLSFFFFFYTSFEANRLSLKRLLFDSFYFFTNWCVAPNTWAHSKRWWSSWFCLLFARTKYSFEKQKNKLLHFNWLRTLVKRFPHIWWIMPVPYSWYNETILFWLSSFQLELIEIHQTLNQIGNRKWKIAAKGVSNWIFEVTENTIRFILPKRSFRATTEKARPTMPCCCFAFVCMDKF